MVLLRGPWQPAWVVGRAYDRFFTKIAVGPAWEDAARRAAQRGTVVHVVRNVSLLDLLLLDHLTRRFDLPRIGFANELGAWLGPPALGRAAPRLRETVLGGQSAVLFMKRPPSVLPRASATHRGRSEGDDLLRVLIEAQRTAPREIIMLPQTFVWTQKPEQLASSVVDTLFGSADFPGELRAAGQLLFNHKSCVIRAGEPLSLRELLEQEDAGDDALMARRLTYALLRKVERERRAVLGPVQKPPSRVQEEVLRSPKLKAILRDLGGPDEAQRAALEDRARQMLRELETTPDPGTLRGLEIAAGTLVDRVYAGVDVDAEGIERVRDAARRGSVIFLPSHKSHVDYLLLSFVLRKNGLMVPVVAAGDNLSFFPVGPIFRRAGAFFIRRSFKRDRLYTAVVDAYIRRLIRDGFAIEFFLEGGRSRTGKLLPPKLGLLNMVVDAALGVEGRTISFVPVSIGYERMMEEGAYASELSGAPKRKEDAAALLKVSAVLREKYGRANVQFGQIIELGALRAQVGAPGEEAISPGKRRALVTRLGHLVMREINQVTAVTPGSLVAMTLLCHRRRGLPHVELVEHAARLAKLVQRLGARTTPSLLKGREGGVKSREGGVKSREGGGVRELCALREASIREAALLYVRGGLVRQHVPGDMLTGAARRRARIYAGDDVIYTVPDEHRLLLDYAKNSIVHLFVDRALGSVALLGLPGPPAPLDEVRERARALSRLFKLEFMFRADTGFDQNFDEMLATMIDEGEVTREGESVAFGPGHDGLDGRGWVTFYAAVIRNFIESYRIAGRTARVLTRGPLGEKELVARALRIGEQMFLGGEIERSEAVSQTTLENAFAAFLEQGYLRRVEGKLALAESFAAEDAAAKIEARVAGYLLRRGADASW